MGIKRDEESIGLILVKDFDSLRIVFVDIVKSFMKNWLRFEDREKREKPWLA